ncbi:MAG: F0F1 ATP synthase subunit epsilon [Candidatus Paceibacterota bacterium]
MANEKEQSKKSEDEYLNVRIISLGEVLWEGSAKAISAENTTGFFDILPQHANFITILKDSPITVHTDNKKEEFSFPRSVLYAENNQVKIYAGV